MKSIVFCGAAFLCVSGAFGIEPALVPQPIRWSENGGEPFKVQDVLIVSTPDESAWSEHLGIFGEHWDRLTQGRSRVKVGEQEGALLVVRKNDGFGDEGYELEVNEKQILITAESLKGLAHATASLLQLIGGNGAETIPQVTIEDRPEISYRSVMIDMGRNPHSLGLLKETIDLLWFYKIDSLHLHLTDDQRIAFPSKTFPKLWDGKITAEQFAELEAYAVLRGVTLIPELEVPGHSGLLRRHYPEIFGESASELASSEEALQGIKTLLDEMMEVFSSSPFVHIGGDEAFGVPVESQRDLINTLHAYLKSKGRETLVWEGPSRGRGANRVHPEVIHLNWRTINYRADQMIEDGHRVVNAAWDPLYLVDHYPRTNFTMTSPRHLYESLALTRFKHVNPGIPTFANPVEVAPSDQLIGFCMPWWEGREENFLPQVVPRVIPFAEVAWNPGIDRAYGAFSARAERTEAIRRAAFYPIRIEASDQEVSEDGVFHDRLTVRLELDRLDKSEGRVELRYTVDGADPDLESILYQGAIELTESKQVRARAFVDGNPIGHGSRRKFTGVKPEKNLALGKPVSSSVSGGPPFSVDRITDGGIGNLDFYLGYPAQPEPIAITIDLETIEKISRIKVFAYTISGSYEKYSVAVSTDGQQFEEIASRLEKPDAPTPAVEHRFDPRDVRYVRILSHGNWGYVFDSFSKLIEVQVKP